MAWIRIAVEGTDDEAVARRLCLATGHEVDTAYVTRGKGNLDPRLSGYNEAARYTPWLVLRDLDRDADCAPNLIARILPQRTPGMCFRIPVRALETWLLADRSAIAEYLSVPTNIIPALPEAVNDPKETMLSVSRRSRSRTIRDEMIPSAGITARVGAGYTAHLVEFASSRWDPIRASERSQSLTKCIHRLREMDE